MCYNFINKEILKHIKYSQLRVYFYVLIIFSKHQRNLLIECPLRVILFKPVRGHVSLFLSMFTYLVHSINNLFSVCSRILFCMFMCLFFSLFTCLFFSACSRTCLPACSRTCLLVLRLAVHLPNFQPVCVPILKSVCVLIFRLFTYLFTYFSACSHTC